MYLRSANRNHTQCSKTWYLMARRRRRAWSIIWMPRRSWQIAGRYGRYVMSRLRQWGKWLLPSSSWGRPKPLRSVVAASLSATRYQCPFLLRNTSWMLFSCQSCWASTSRGNTPPTFFWIFSQPNSYQPISRHISRRSAWSNSVKLIWNPWKNRKPPVSDSGQC